MNKFKINLLIISLVLFGLVGLTTAFAATTPSLGLATTYAILAGTYTNTSAATTITGDIGFTTGPAQAPLGVHTNYGSGAPTPSARVDTASTLSSLNSQVCTFTFAPGAIDLATDITHGPIGVYTPGVYCSTGAMDIGAGGITLNGSGTYIFRAVGALTSTDASVVTLSGASVCDVFWTPTAATTLGANTTFKGTIIDNANAITVGANTNWAGRALSLGAGTVTTGNTVSITAPTTCAVPSTSQRYGTINVVKTVINDNGGTKTVADFPLLVNGAFVASGVTNRFGASNSESFKYSVTETTDPNYTRTFSGDCDANGDVFLNPNDAKFCIVTNNDIGTPVVTPPVPPIIDVVKVPSPLSLPAGPGSVTYTYTLRNIGTVPVTDITMVGDTCSPITLVSGDTDGDKKLDLNETWVHKCTTTLSETHTNTVVATGWANGISATDIASATVVVGMPIVPPLIHVTKVPSPLTLPAGGGSTTYTYKVTNPGTVALSNVSITDDKCTGLPGRVVGHPGDLNKNDLLESNETWSFTCKTKLTKTTTNIGTATGSANGLTAKDFAIATVVVATASPKLPNTGITSQGNISWDTIALSIALLLVSALSIVVIKRRTT